MDTLKKDLDNLAMFSDMQGQLIDDLYTINVSACGLYFGTFQNVTFGLSKILFYKLLS